LISKLFFYSAHREAEFDTLPPAWLTTPRGIDFMDKGFVYVRVSEHSLVRTSHTSMICELDCEQSLSFPSP